MTSADGVTVRGGATAEELGAVLAVLTKSRRTAHQPGGYELWRRNRLQALRLQRAQPAGQTSG